ncbi:MAG: protein-glutamate O-methyltransferase CheR [Pirellulales bacterium]|nr:protein-glutamate O-methyltransferase CheR [Pirellulales bacterium]
MQVTPEDITAVAALVGELCGVVLDQSKGYLIESRLAGVAKEAGCANYTELCRMARLPNNRHLQNQIIDGITTQETLFFRDGSPFEALQYKALPELIDSKSGSAFPKRIRIWSAAASTGQEAYSIAMVMHELIPDILSWDVNILGTDICDTAIKQASLGRYAAHEIQRGLQPPVLSKYFINEGRTWRVKDELRSMVTFQRRNLLEPLTGLGPFDIIFCRNVAIYFNAETRRDLFNRISDRLAPGGYLFVGSSESLGDLGPRFMPQHHCRSVFYQPNRRPALVPA